MNLIGFHIIEFCMGKDCWTSGRYNWSCWVLWKDKRCLLSCYRAGCILPILVAPDVYHS